MANFNEAVAVVLKHEGGLINHPSDPGGVTNFGISLRYVANLSDEMKQFLMLDMDGDGDVDADDIRLMTKMEAKRIYKSQWWDKFKYGDIISQEVATKIFDMAVNMGPARAHRIAQTAVNNAMGGNHEPLKVDGILGPKSFARMEEVQDELLMHYLRLGQAKFYMTLIEKEPELAVFKDGWLNRAAA